MKTKKIVSLLLAGTLTGSLCAGLAGCGDDADTLQITSLNAGYGVQWLYDLAEGYKAHHPEVEISIEAAAGNEDKKFTDQLESGETDVDIYFARDAMYDYMQRGQSVGGTYYDCLIEDLTDFFKSENPYDNGKKIVDKIRPDILEAISMEKNGVSKQYTVPWVQDALGILYNKDIFAENNLEVPLTTDHMLEVARDAKGKGLIPFVDSYADSYLTVLVEDWVTQYEGHEVMEGFWAGYTPSGTRYEPEVLSYQGILETYEVLYQMLCTENGFMDSECNELTFTEAQTHIIDKSYKVCMQPNGAWIQREMEANYDASQVNLGMMKTPIISSIVEKLEYRNGTAYMTDSMLREVIKAIDNGQTSYDGVSANDFNRLSEARNTVYSWTFGHIGYIPVYSDKKDVAKDFLHYMVSDEGQRIFTKATYGCTQPYEFDYLNDSVTAPAMNEFMKDVYKRVSTSKTESMEGGKDPLFAIGGVTLAYNWTGTTMIQAFSVPHTEPTYMTAQGFYDYRIKLYRDQWDTICTTAGVKRGG